MWHATICLAAFHHDFPEASNDCPGLAYLFLLVTTYYYYYYRCYYCYYYQYYYCYGLLVLSLDLESRNGVAQKSVDPRWSRPIRLLAIHGRT